MSEEFPYKMEPFTDEDTKKLRKSVKNNLNYMFVGPQRYVMPTGFTSHAQHIYNMPLRSTDTFVITFPRSGTTWTQEMVWLLANDLDYERAKSVPLTRRFPFLEMSAFLNDRDMTDLKQKNADNPEASSMVETLLIPGYEVVEKLPSPRFIKSHMPLSLLPPNLLSTAKVVYVARDPRDVVVSNYHFYKDISITKLTDSFEDYFDVFRDNLVAWCPLFSHTKEAWEQRDNPNMLFIFYEDMLKDLKAAANRVSQFLNKSYSEEQLTKLCEYLKFDNFKNNASVDLHDFRKIGIFDMKKKTFIRKGKAGAWNEYFTGELATRAQMWIDDNLRGTDLCFPISQSP